MALKLHIGIPESCSEGPAATIALPHQTHDDHGGDEDGWDDHLGGNEDGDLDDNCSLTRFMMVMVMRLSIILVRAIMSVRPKVCDDLDVSVDEWQP